eukprot:1883465-Prorocentrum_lima.AAC.1
MAESRTPLVTSPASPRVPSPLLRQQCSTAFHYEWVIRGLLTSAAALCATIRAVIPHRSGSGSSTLS